ncbi:tripartite tricarboxylate transporter substrate binding protein [Comamonas thiooxydans]|uniref:ABC transporter substrate-binding protein n=1 Tax=Comamonas thiooxydans TaxID=363952 RepID=A0A0E3B9J5_9BURK|nr:tripartite tricarboxylate transporter substrate binding protein [Comamonas thiooxydans]KGG83656.1 ABC transporter substrate-binding protein [Comamonas thiooxydans]MDH1475234.1 tripartite tricarboxylate transporter substrate binding protein [Comamonas thiooxydans]
MKKSSRLWLAAISAIALHGTVQAQTYPGKPIRMVVPYAAGGAADITARVIAKEMAQSLGVPVVVDNRGGANGNIGADAVAKAAPDGYTVLFTASGPIVANHALYAKLPYDPLKDLLPVSQATSYQYALVVATASPIQNLAQLVERAKAAPATATYGSSGIGGGAHLAGAMLARMSGVEMTHVPYKGNAPALADVLGGQLTFTFDTVVTTVPQIAGGKLRALAVSGPARSPLLPRVPTMQELGFKGIAVTQFQGLFVPAKTDAVIVERLHQAVANAVKSPSAARRLQVEGGYELIGSSPQVFAKLVQDEYAAYGKLIRELHIQAD